MMSYSPVVLGATCWVNGDIGVGRIVVTAAGFVVDDCSVVGAMLISVIDRDAVVFGLSAVLEGGTDPFELT